MKPALIPLLPFLLLARLLGQSPAPLPPQKVEVKKDPNPRVTISPAGRIDLGSTGPRERKVQQYLFKNTSKTPIRFRLLDPSPGVRVEGPALTDPIPAGGTLPLVVWVDAEEAVGWQTRVVKLESDDPKQGHYFLPLAMTVRPDLTVDGERKGFQDVAPHESPEVVFTFSRETGEPTQVKLTSTLPPYLDSEVLTKGGKTELHLVMRPAKVPDGMRMGLETLQVETNAPKQKTLTLYLDWKLVMPIEATPTRVVFLQPQTMDKDVVLKAKDAKPFKLESWQVEGEGFEARPGDGTTLKVRCTAQTTAKAVLVLRFEGQALPLRVPLSYLPPK